MSELPTPEGIFQDVIKGLKPYFWGRDDYGVDTWEHIWIADDAIDANRILVKYGMESADKVRFGLQSEFGETTAAGDVIPAQKTIDISLYDNALIRCYSLTKFEDSPEVSLRKNILVDDDRTDLFELLKAAINGADPLREVREHLHEMHEVSSSETLALSALAKLLLVRNKDY